MHSTSPLDTELQYPRAASRRPSVLHVGKFYPPHMGGIETHLQLLCTELSKFTDLRVLVASDDATNSEELLDNVSVSRVSTRLTLAATPLCPGLIGEIRRSSADIIHLHWPNPMAVLAYLASGHPGKLVITYHSDTIRQKILGSLFEPFLRRALGRSSAIIITSPDYARTSPVLKDYQDRCHVIPLGIDVSEFEHADSARVSELRQRFGERLIISVGRLVYYKGFEFLIRAMSRVNGKLLIIGKGPLRGELQDLVVKLGLADRVTLTGEIPEKLVPYYHAADLFALASIARSEAFGLVQVEAMSAGLPVVNTRLDSGVPFVSLHEQTGLTVPPADPDAMSSALNLLLDNRGMRAAFGQAARARARQEFSLNAMASRTLALYDAVMAR